jgi:hypothetical protein
LEMAILRCCSARRASKRACDSAFLANLSATAILPRPSADYPLTVIGAKRLRNSRFLLGLLGPFA